MSYRCARCGKVEVPNEGELCWKCQLEAWKEEVELWEKEFIIQVGRGERE